MNNLIINDQNKLYTVNGNALNLNLGTPYIRGGADGSYIDTGIIPNENTRVIVWARNWNPYITNNPLFGQFDSTGYGFAVSIWTGTSTGRIGVYYGLYNDPYIMFADAFDYLGDYHKYELSADGFKIDDVIRATVPERTLNISYPLHLFGANKSDASHTNMSLPADICACKIYQDGILVRDYTPVSFPSVGLYDAVSDTIFTNAGSGSFTYGTFVKDKYLRINKLILTHEQYLDTLIYGTKELPVVMKFSVRGTSVGYPTPFGTMTSNTNGTYFIFQYGSSSYLNRYANFYINTTTQYQLYNNNKTKLTNKIVVFVKNATNVTLYENNAVLGTSKTYSTNEFTTPGTIMLGTTRFGSNPSASNSMNGYIYYAGFGAERNFIPVSYNGVGGMLDTYHDVFYPSTSGVNFIKGNYLNPQYEYEDGMRVVRHWEAEDEVISNTWQDRVMLTNITLTSATRSSDYWQFTNSSTTSATSYGTFVSSLGNLGYHWKVVTDIAIKYNSSAHQYGLDFGSVQGTTDGTQSFCIGLNSNKRWAFNTKFNGNSTASTYAPSATNLTETDISDGDWVRRTVTIGVRASETEGMDETYAIVEGLGSGVSAPFTPINFNNWMSGWYIGRSAITPASNYPYASNVRVYSLKVYCELL